MTRVRSQAGATPDGTAVADLTRVLRSGRAAGAQERHEKHTAGAAEIPSDRHEPTALGADPERAMLDAVVGQAHVREALQALEEWLDGTVEAEAALPLATSWALPAADLDLETVTGEVRLYIDAYPLEARVLGGLPERASTWLVARLAQNVTSAARLPAVRRAIASLAAAATPRFPASAASLRAVVDDVDDDALWYQLALGIVESELGPGAAQGA